MSSVEQRARELCHELATHGPKNWRKGLVEETQAALAALREQPEARGVVDAAMVERARQAYKATKRWGQPGMTPAVRYDLTPAQHEGAIRDHLISLGWTPPGGDAAGGGA